MNVAGQQLDQPEFVGEVAAALDDAGLPATSLTLEITESSVVERPEVIRERLAALRAMGVSVAIDDFGTGYSALGHLQQFPLDVLKIDRAFVDRVTRGGPPAAVTRTLVALGEALSLRTVAEGIETEAQRAHLAVPRIAPYRCGVRMRPQTLRNLRPLGAEEAVAGHQHISRRVEQQDAPAARAAERDLVVCQTQPGAG